MTENSHHCYSAACPCSWWFSKKLPAVEDGILVTARLAFCSVSRRTCIQMSVFNGSIHKLHVFMQSIKSSELRVLWVLQSCFQITKPYIPVERDFCVLSLGLPQWHKLSVWQPVLHMKDCSKGLYRRSKSFLVIIPLVKTMVWILMAYTGEGVQLAGVDEVPPCALHIFKSLHEAV